MSNTVCVVSTFRTTNAGKEDEKKVPKGQLPLVRVLDENGDPTEMFLVHLSHFRDDDDGHPVMGVEIFSGISGYLDAIKCATENLGDCAADPDALEKALTENAVAKAKADVKKVMDKLKEAAKEKAKAAAEAAAAEEDDSDES